MKAHIEIPKGWRRVKRGRAKSGDRILMQLDNGVDSLKWSKIRGTSYVGVKGSIEFIIRKK